MFRFMYGFNDLLVQLLHELNRILYGLRIFPQKNCASRLPPLAHSCKISSHELLTIGSLFLCIRLIRLYNSKSNLSTNMFNLFMNRSKGHQGHFKNSLGNLQRFQKLCQI